MFIKVLPPATKVRGFATPAEGIRAWLESENGKASLKLREVVSGSTIHSFRECDACVILILDSGARLEVKAIEERCSVSLNTMEEEEIVGAARMLGDLVEVDWPGDIGRKQWHRLSILEGVVGHTIQTIALHVFGASLYLSSSKVLEFSSLTIAGTTQPILYWDIMKYDHKRV